MEPSDEAEAVKTARAVELAAANLPPAVIGERLGLSARAVSARLRRRDLVWRPALSRWQRVYRAAQ